MVDRSAAFAHCEALLREADHDAWIATLYAPATLRPRLHALGAFATEIAQVHERVRQPIAGEIRLQWWQDVIDGERAAEAAAHPVATALLATLAEADLPRPPFADLLDTHRLALYDEPPPDLDALKGRCATMRGVPVRLAAVALGLDDAVASPAATEAGVALGLADLVEALRTGARRVLLPPDLLRRHALTQAMVDALSASPPLRAALDELAGLAHRSLAALRSRRRTLGPGGPAFLLTALVEPRLVLGPDLFAPRPALAAWRRQVRLWRAARRGGVL